jgi:hypothetical protein
MNGIHFQTLAARAAVGCATAETIRTRVFGGVFYRNYNEKNKHGKNEGARFFLKAFW